MSKSVVIEGFVRADGTLEVEDKVRLPAGRVKVTVETVSNEQKAKEFLAFIHELQTLRESQGVQADAESAIADAQRVRDEFEEQLEELGQLQEESRRLRLEAERKEAK